MKKILIAALVCFLSAGPLNLAAAAENKPREELHDEMAAYRKVDGKQGSSEARSRYMKLLSPGGQVYFLACRRDYQEALDALKSLPRNSSGSHLYVQAFCLEGLGKHQEAVKTYQLAKSKIGFAFNPGFRFFLESGKASMLAGNDKNAIADFEAARVKVIANPSNESDVEWVVPLLEKRKIAAIELKGRHKEAFEKYLAIFNKTKDQFHLQESLTADEIIKKKASIWLKDHPSVPANVTDEETAKFYVTQGKAYLATGNLLAGKKSLDSAVNIKVVSHSPLLFERRAHLESAELTSIQDPAKILLVKLNFKEQNYRECCKFIRKLFNRDPFNELVMYDIISIRDVPQLVLQKDVDLHSAELESFLDRCDYVVFHPSKEEISKRYDFLKDPLYVRAMEEVEADRFAACYDTLAEFLTAKQPSSAVDHYRWQMFATHYSHVANLYKIAVGIAAKKSERGLSLLHGYRTMTSEWTAIEDVLLGRKRRPVDKNVFDYGHMTDREVDAYCHFAAAVRAMSQKNMKQAISEFSAVKVDQSLTGRKSPLMTYTASLKRYCEKQK